MLARVARIVGVMLGIVALSAPAAGAFEFRAHHAGQPAGPFLTRGGSGTAGHQQFGLGPFEVSCAAARSTGSIAQDRSRFFLDSVKFSQCTAEVPVGGGSVPVPVRFEEPFQFGFDAVEGFIELVSPVTAQIKSLKCTASIPAQLLVVPAEEGSQGQGAGAGKANPPFFIPTLVPTLNLHTFPSGEQEKLLIEFDQPGKLTLSGQCAGLGDTFEYSGDLVDEIHSGDLSWEARESIESEEEQLEEEEGREPTRRSPPWQPVER
jgi:hypothetical protein